MAASKNTKKSTTRSTGNNKKLASNNNGQRKKVMILSLLAFAIVGVAVIARSFAATPIRTTTAAPSLSVQNVPGSTCTNDLRNSASKGNTTILRVSCNTYGPGVLVWGMSATLSADQLSACTNVSVTGTSKKKIEMNVDVNGRRSSYTTFTISPNSDGSAKWTTMCMPFTLLARSKVQANVKFTQSGVLNVGSIYVIAR